MLSNYPLSGFKPTPRVEDEGGEEKKKKDLCPLGKMEFLGSNHCQQGEQFGWQGPYLQIGQPQLYLAVFFVSKHHRTASVCDLQRRNRDGFMPCGRKVGLRRPLIGPPLFRSRRGKMI